MLSVQKMIKYKSSIVKYKTGFRRKTICANDAEASKLLLIFCCLSLILKAVKW